MQIHTIDLEFQGAAGTIASFLIESDAGLILVEPGPGSTLDTLRRKIGELGHDADDVCAVFVTHAHLDHAGGAGWWAQQGATLYAHPKAARHLIDPSKLIDSARGVFGEAFDSLWGEMLAAPEGSVQVLEDGAVVEIEGVEIEALDTPGHCFHHHAFAVGDALFTGDVAGARLGESGYISVTSAPPQFHLDSYLQSIDRLAARNFGTLYLTHFGRVDAVGAHWSAYRPALIGAAELVKSLLDDGGDAESVRIAYQAFQMEQAFKTELPPSQWEDYQRANHTDMCADGLRLYWEREAAQ